MRALTVSEIDEVSGALTYAINVLGGSQPQLVADGFHFTYTVQVEYKNGATYVYGYNS